MFLRRFVGHAVVAVLVVGVGVGSLVGAPVARGDEVGDLKARASEISSQMSVLQSRVVAQTNAVEGARYKVSQLDDEIAAASAKLVAARADEGRRRKDLSQYAVRAYVSGGSSGGLAAVMGTAGDQLGQRSGYMTASVGSQQQLVDDLVASQKLTQEQAKRLDAAKAEAASVQADAEASQASAQGAADQLAALQSQLNGKLATAVAAKQAAVQAAAQAAARAAAQVAADAQAARAAVRVAVALPPSVSVPGPDISGSGPDTSGSSGGSSSVGTSGSSGGGFVAPPNASAAAIAIAAAESQLGVPYVWGGTSPGVGLDCSGLTQYAYAQAGINLPRVTYSQEGAGQVVPLSQIQPGDLVFYWNGGHVALYIGGGQVIHAPHTGTVVQYGSLYMGQPELVVRPS